MAFHDLLAQRQPQSRAWILITRVQALEDNEEAVNAFPNYQNLFGKADICECEHCRSVYSPGAYFADLLMFLKNRTWGIPAPYNNTKDVLFERRPDLRIT